MDKTILLEVGLTKNEIKVYLALLDLGTCIVNKLAEKTGLHRRNIYDSLNKLIDKGLTTFIFEGKIKHFQATSPKKLLSYLEEEKRKIEIKGHKISALIPELEAKLHGLKSQKEAKIYRGNEGIKSIFDDMLNYKKNFFIGGDMYIIRKLPHYWPNYNKKRIKFGIAWYDLVRYGTDKKELSKEKLIFFKHLPKEFSGNPNVILVYGDKVVNVLWSDEPFAFMIQSKEIAENYKKYHKYLWDKIAR